MNDFSSRVLISILPLVADDIADEWWLNIVLLILLWWNWSSRSFIFTRIRLNCRYVLLLV